MCFERIESNIQWFLFKNKFEPYIKNDKTQPCIDTSRCGIPERLQTHQFAERRVKEINDR